MGRWDLLLESLERWRPLVARGNGVLAEYWSQLPGEGSLCHAWSATPTFDLSRHVLGVRPTAPGWTRVEVSPHLGRLRSARGAIPTPLGLIHVDCREDGAVEVNAPEGVEVRTAHDLRSTPDR